MTSYRASKGNSNQHGGKDVCTCFGSVRVSGYLAEGLKLCLQNDAEEKINITLDKLRSIVESCEVL